jgi:hypothetical protein
MEAAVDKKKQMETSSGALTYKYKYLYLFLFLSLNGPSNIVGNGKNTRRS